MKSINEPSNKKVAFVFASRPAYGRFPYQEGPLKRLILRYGTWVRDIAEGVAAQGFRVETHLPMFFSSSCEVNGVLWKFYRSFYFPKEKRGYEVVPGLFRGLWVSRPDIIHIHGLGWLPLALEVTLWGRLLRKPVVLHHHGEMIEGRSSKYKRLLKYTLRLGSAIICLTPSIAEQLQALSGKQPVVLSGYLQPIFRPSQERPSLEEPIIVTPGEVIPGKGQLTVAKAFKLLKRDFPRARLICPGPLSDASYIEKIKQTEQGVEFPGILNKKELADLYRSAHVGVCASFREGFGLAALELIASGCPAILSDIPSFRYLALHSPGVSLFPVQDEEKLYVLLRNYLENWTVWKERALKGAEKVREVFSWENYFYGLKTLYEKLSHA